MAFLRQYKENIDLDWNWKILEAKKCENYNKARRDQYNNVSTKENILIVELGNKVKGGRILSMKHYKWEGHETSENV